MKECFRCKNKFKERKTKSGFNASYCLDCVKDTRMEIYDDE